MQLSFCFFLVLQAEQLDTLSDNGTIQAALLRRPNQDTTKKKEMTALQ